MTALTPRPRRGAVEDAKGANDGRLRGAEERDDDLQDNPDAPEAEVDERGNRSV